jgi:Fe-S-cluster containining protein
MDICKECGSKCCKDLVIWMDTKVEQSYLDARGIRCTEENKAFKYNIPHICPMLKDNRCTIHDNKPETCRKFKCERL